MGIGTWVAAGIVAVAIARIVPLRAKPRWTTDAVIALFATLIAGAAATALDFGGWNEPDWRAAVFCLFGTLAALALPRLRAL